MLVSIVLKSPPPQTSSVSRTCSPVLTVEAIERRDAEVEQRMVSVESSVESVQRGETDENWKPVGVPETKILLLASLKIRTPQAILNSDRKKER